MDHVQNKSMQSKRGNLIWYVVIAAVLIIAVILISAFLLISKKSSNSGTTSIYLTQITGNNINVVSSSKLSPCLNTSGYFGKANDPKATLLTAKINNYTPTQSQFTVNYSGVVNTTISEYILLKSCHINNYVIQPSQISGNINSVYEKYFNASRAYSVIAINKTSGIYNSSRTRATSNTSVYYLSNGTTYTCVWNPKQACASGGSGFGYLNQSPLAFMRNYTISNLTATNTSYNGRNCTLLSGLLNRTQQNSVGTTIIAIGTFSSCILRSYNLALYTRIYLNTIISKPYDNNGTIENAASAFSINLYVTNLLNSSSKSFVNSFNKSAIVVTTTIR